MSDRTPLAERIRRGDALAGLAVKMPAPSLVEAAGFAGLDFVLIDTEHGAGGGVELEHHLRAADAAGIAALVRVSGPTPGEILHALDAGACGIVVPHVCERATAEAAVRAAHYPPRGRRGLALSTRAGRHGFAATAEHLERASRETAVLVQIEDAEAVGHEHEILSVEGVDAVFLGLGDLSISMGHPGRSDAAEVGRAVEGIVAAARGLERAVMAVADDRDAARTWRERGATIVVFVATNVIAGALRGLAGEPTIRPAEPSRAPRTGKETS